MVSNVNLMIRCFEAAPSAKDLQMGMRYGMGEGMREGGLRWKGSIAPAA